MAYLSVAQFKARTIMPQGDVDALELREVGFLSSCIEAWSAEIDARLSKRYDVPFADPTPPIVQRWIVVLVTRDAYGKRGFDPTNPVDQALILDSATMVLDQIKEAANAKDGLYELPSKVTTRSLPMSYSESTPYDWMDQ